VRTIGYFEDLLKEEDVYDAAGIEITKYEPVVQRTAEGH
jgi:hypothetical protein